MWLQGVGLVFTAARPIAKGEGLSIMYGELAEKTLTERRRHLEEIYSFVCACERCVAEEKRGSGGQGKARRGEPRARPGSRQQAASRPQGGATRGALPPAVPISLRKGGSGKPASAAVLVCPLRSEVLRVGANKLRLSKPVLRGATLQGVPAEYITATPAPHHTIPTIALTDCLCFQW